MKRAEVIIAGAGPAGSVLAYELARRGIEVLLLEKQYLPRYKCCAGGVMVATARLLDGVLQDALQDSTEDTIRTITVCFKGDTISGDYLGQPLVYTVTRDKFDSALTRKAEDSGAVLIQNCEVRQVSECDDRVLVFTADGEFEGRFLIGADGYQSAVARAAGLKDGSLNITAMNNEVSIPAEAMAARKASITIELGYVRGGYGWVFPKSNCLSVGAGCLGGNASGLKHKFSEFFRSLNLPQHAVVRTGGGVIPACWSNAVITRGRVALIGDAAGLADPLTGEGIRNAILSAQLAAPCIEGSLKLGKAELLDYQKAVDMSIVPEMRAGYILQRILVRFPSLVFRVLHDDSVWQAACQILRGETTYTAAVGRLRVLSSIQPFLQKLRGKARAVCKQKEEA